MSRDSDAPTKPRRARRTRGNGTMTWGRFFDIAEKKRQIVSTTRRLVQLQNSERIVRKIQRSAKARPFSPSGQNPRKKPGRRAFAELVRTGEIFAVEAGFLHLCMTY